MTHPKYQNLYGIPQNCSVTLVLCVVGSVVVDVNTHTHVASCTCVSCVQHVHTTTNVQSVRCTYAQNMFKLYTVYMHVCIANVHTVHMYERLCIHAVRCPHIHTGYEGNGTYRLHTCTWCVRDAMICMYLTLWHYVCL